MDATFEAIAHNKHPRFSFVNIAHSKWVYRHGPFSIRPVTKADHASWQGYEYVLITKHGDHVDVMGRKEQAQVIADGLNERFALMLMTEGTKAEGL